MYFPDQNIFSYVNVFLDFIACCIWSNAASITITGQPAKDKHALKHYVTTWPWPPTFWIQNHSHIIGHCVH